MRNFHPLHEAAFSNSIEHRLTGRMLPTLVLPVEKKELVLLTKNWLFDWANEAVKYDVFKLVTVEEQEVVQGLVSCEKRNGFYQVILVENAPFNRGFGKTYEGVAGNLFAFVCKLSKENGFDGVVAFEAKTALIEHYKRTLGAISMGNSIKMFIDEINAAKLIETYF